MQYTVDQYAHALYETLARAQEKKHKAIIRRFAKMLGRHRATPYLNRILRAFEKRYLQERGLVKVDIQSVSPLSSDVKRKITSALGAKTYVYESQNSGLGAGLTILINNELLIDASAKRQIDMMLRRI